MSAHTATFPRTRTQSSYICGSCRAHAAVGSFDLLGFMQYSIGIRSGLKSTKVDRNATVSNTYTRAMASYFIVRNNSKGGATPITGKVGTTMLLLFLHLLQDNYNYQQKCSAVLQIGPSLVSRARQLPKCTAGDGT